MTIDILDGMMRSLSSCFEANWMWRRIQTRTAEAAAAGRWMRC